MCQAISIASENDCLANGFSVQGPFGGIALPAACCCCFQVLLLAPNCVAQYEAAEGEAREAKRGLWQQQQAISPRQKGKTYQAALAAAASNSVMASSEEKEREASVNLVDPGIVFSQVGLRKHVGRS
jgi:hypothetical protein